MYSPISPLQKIVVEVNDERGYVLKPDTRIKFEGVISRFSHPIIWQINAQGIRENKLVEYRPPNNKFRIATYGDSETFGWSVDFDYTFQEQMEQIDSTFEVINFGVPGYNISNIAKHIEQTAGQFKPDLLIYIIHSNDFESPLKFNRLNIDSELIRRLVYLYFIRWKKKQFENRRSPLVISKFVSELHRITNFCKENNIPFAIAFLDWNDRFVLRMNKEVSEYFLDPKNYDNRVFNLSPIIGSYPKVDDHLSKEAHRRLAIFLYTALAKS
jgi:hypothetical protein